MKRALLLFLGVAGPLALGRPVMIVAAESVPVSWDFPPAQQTRGVFWREHWYERGLTNANPAYERRLRVNSPEVSLHPTFGQRVEARENGLLLIKTEEDLFQITDAEFYLELWGGHPGTANKRVSVNGRSTYALPRVGTEEGHCTYIYPTLSLSRSDLVNGWNAFQLALDQGTTFWGHALVDQACLRVALTNDHPDLIQSGLARFEGRVVAQPLATPAEGYDLILHSSGVAASTILSVDFQAWYFGYDENGNRQEVDWHGFTQDRRPLGHIGSAHTPPFRVTWDTAMVPAQKNVAVRGLVRFKNVPGLVYVTPASSALVVKDHPRAAVALYLSPDLPNGFWSRAARKKECHFLLDLEPDHIERAELYVRTWTGGSGEVTNYFTLNGRHFPVAEGTRHIVQYNRLPVEPSWLRAGTNTVELLSGTEHHGIEVFYPGPALMIRYRLP